MSTIRYYQCNICDEKTDDANGGVGLVFRSHHSGDFTLSICRETDGRHLCQACLISIVAYGRPWLDRIRQEEES